MTLNQQVSDFLIHLSLRVTQPSWPTQQHSNLPWARPGAREGGRGQGSPRPLSSLRYTLIPTSILVGLGAAALWSAQGTYLTIVGNMQARKTGQVGKDVVNQYFGIFFLIFQSSGVWGNLISSLVFGQTPTQGNRKWGPPRVPGPSPQVLIQDMSRWSHGAPRPGSQTAWTPALPGQPGRV